MEFVNNEVRMETGSKFLAKVFLYMFIALFITAGVATGVGFLFANLLPYDANGTSQTYANVYLGLLFGSLIALIIVGIWFNVCAFRMKHTLAVPFIIYAILFGILFSSFVMWVPAYLLAIAFGSTSLVFGIMALIGYFSKGNLSVVKMILLGTISGIMVLAITNWIWYLISPLTWSINCLIIEGALFFVTLLSTIIDVHNIKNIAERGMANNNVALYCAFSLYIDFILIFLRILYILLRTVRNN